MMRCLVTLLAIAVAALAGVVSAGAHLSEGAHWEHFYADPTGDSGTAPDITGFELGSSDEGRVFFHVTLKNNLEGGTGALIIFVDSDQSDTTGDPRLIGVDYVFEAYADGHAYDFQRWNATARAWEEAPRTSASVTTTGDGVLFQINRRELGNPTKIDVEAETLAAFDQGGTGQRDWAPDGRLTYDVTRLQLTAPVHKLLQVGRHETLVMAVVRSDTGDYLTGVDGKISCVANVGGRSFDAAAQFLKVKSVPFASCNFIFPPSFKGKKATAQITVTYARRTASSTARFVVK